MIHAGERPEENIESLILLYIVTLSTDFFVTVVKTPQFLTCKSQISVKVVQTAFVGTARYDNIHRAKYTSVQVPRLRWVHVMHHERLLPQTPQVHYLLDSEFLVVHSGAFSQCVHSVMRFKNLGSRVHWSFVVCTDGNNPGCVCAFWIQRNQLS